MSNTAMTNIQSGTEIVSSLVALLRLWFKAVGFKKVHNRRHAGAWPQSKRRNQKAAKAH